MTGTEFQTAMTAVTWLMTYMVLAHMGLVVAEKRKVSSWIQIVLFVLGIVPMGILVSFIATVISEVSVGLNDLFFVAICFVSWVWLTQAESHKLTLSHANPLLLLAVTSASLLFKWVGALSTRFF